MRRLNEIDLARISLLTRDNKYNPLRRIRDGYAKNTYRPLKKHIHDVMNVQPDLFGPVGQTNWATVKLLLDKESRSKAEFAMNVGVAKALHNFSREHGILARSQKFPPIHRYSGENVQYWLNMILAVDNKPVVPFIDPRRSYGLNSEGRRFVFSMMHEQIRMDPDFSGVGLGIFQFAKADNDKRTPVFHLDEGLELFDLGEINEMVSETYVIWQEVLEEKSRNSRHTGTNGQTLF